MSHADAIDYLKNLHDLTDAQMRVALECREKLIEVDREEREFCRLCEFQSIAMIVLAAAAFFGGMLLAAKEENWIKSLVGLICIAVAAGLLVAKLLTDQKCGGAIIRASNRRDHLINDLRVEIRRLESLVKQKSSDHFAA
jgi:hypothetical protein